MIEILSDLNWWLFPIAFVLDLMYIVWMWATEKHMPMVGALSSVSIYAMGLLGTLEAVENKWNMIPLFLGVFFGSYIGIWYKGRKLGQDSSNGTQAG